MDIVFASSNLHKLAEVRKILNNYNILSLEDIGFNDEIVEDGENFFDNALIRARAVRKRYNEVILADDSGLCCNALNGLPGIYSARYAGDHDDKKNRDKLIHDLKGKSHDAYFECCMVLLEGDSYHVFDGRTYGVILDHEEGDTSFGYDCIFYSNDLGKTFGVASSNDKNSCSHRGRALDGVLRYLDEEYI